MSAPAPPPADAARHTLVKESELRLEISSEGAFFQVVSGNAEVFGVEAAEGRIYALRADRRLAIFTWFGADILVWGGVSAAYVSAESQVPLYAALHSQLESRREASSAGGARAGPRVLIVGPSDSGKSSLARVLAGYAVRVGRAPTLVDLDLGQGDVSLPGTIAAASLDRQCLSIEDGFTRIAPLAYFLGNTSAGDVTPVYRNATARLADAVNRRLSAATPVGAAARASGLVINTMGWVDGMGYDLIKDAIKAFAVDVVVVMGHDRTFAALTEDAKTLGVGTGAGVGGSAAPITVLKLARPGGVVERARETRRDSRFARIRTYFYGPPRSAPGLPPMLSPETITLTFDDVTIVRIGGTATDASLVPIGKTSALDPLRVTPVTPTAGSLINHVLAVSFATTEKAIPHVNVAGFVHVRAVNTKEKTITLLAPCGGALPSRYLILGSVTWTEI